MDINKYVTLAIGIALVGIIVGVMGPKSFSADVSDSYLAVIPRRQSPGHNWGHSPRKRGNYQYASPAPHAVRSDCRTPGNRARCNG